MSERERTSSHGSPADGKTGRRLLRLREQAKHPGPSAAENGQQRAAQFAFATSFFATSRSLPGGGQEAHWPRAPHATRANRSGKKGRPAAQKGSEPGMGADRSGQREEAPGTRADGKRGKNKKRAECWAHRNGQKARDQTHGQIETGKGHWRKLVTTY